MTPDSEARNRILVIGLDGATFDLIKPWVAQGRLPTIGRMIADGVHANLASVPNMNSAPAWSSFATGTNPGKHGIFYFDERVPNTYSKRYLNRSHRSGDSFWKILSDQGQRVCVINVPMTFPADELNGIMLAGLDSPSVQSEGFAHPPSVLEELSSQVGDYIIEPGIPGYVKAGKKDQALARLFEAADKRLAYARYLLAEYPWELFIVVFTATDAVHHFFWKDMDPRHPQHDEEEAKIYGDAILRVYERMDDAVQTLVEEAKPSTTLIMSDHGGGFNQRGAEYLNHWLRQKGLQSHGGFGDGPSLWRSFLSSVRGFSTRQLGFAYRQLDKHLSRETKLKLVKLFPGVREQVESAMCFEGIDWSATKAYSDGARDEIWINLRGREPGGIVEPGEEYDHLCTYLIDELMACRDIKTGERVVESAFRRDEIYSGDHVDRAPDISIRWKTDFVISGLAADGNGGQADGESEAPPAPLNNGGHRINGILIVEGENIAKGVQLETASIMDVAPTILYLFGADIPANIDGRVLEGAITEAYLDSHPVKVLPPGTEAGKDSSSTEYSDEDARVIEDRLKGMGYLG
jgi:predicted AlkP superfamily phosphohydrolase/phosphomutase